jgi:bilin biosynthesis protein
MRLKPCPKCSKDIPSGIEVCPYCRHDDQGRDTREEAGLTASAAAQVQEDLNALGSDDNLARKTAAERLAQRGAAVIPILTSVLNEHTRKGLSEVARLLGRLRDQRAIEPLVQALKLGDEELKVSAVWALSQFNDARALEELIRESQRSDSTVQSYVAHTLADFQDARVLPNLIRLTEHPSRDVAFQAIWSLGEVGNAEAVMPLRRSLGRKDPIIRAAAQAALKRLGAPARRAYSKRTYALGSLGIAAVAGLIFFWLCR